MRCCPKSCPRSILIVFFCSSSRVVFSLLCCIIAWKTPKKKKKKKKTLISTTTTTTTTTTTRNITTTTHHHGSNRRRAFVPSIGPRAIGPNGGVQLRRLRLGDGDRESNRRLPVRFLGGRENDDTKRRTRVPEKTNRGDRGDLRRHGRTVFSDGELRGEADGVSEITLVYSSF